MQIVYPVAVLGLISLGFGALLALVAKFFAVATDPRVEVVREVLPGVNCGACGYPGCTNFAEAVVHEETELNGCIPGGTETAKAVAEVLGREAVAMVPLIATLFCIGDQTKAADLFIYMGVEDCAVAMQFNGGHKACNYGCLGLGNCVRICPFDAIKMGIHGLPIIDPDTCMGCGLCAKICPRNLIRILLKSGSGHLALCSSHDRGKAVSNACEVGCIACKACIKACPQEAIVMEDNLAVIDLEKCNDCDECVPKCKPGTIHRRSVVLQMV
ncbi:MAG TPA: RnfABCDGE type electron transport complex subunit B [Candidatus Limnocylindrales bacterium]|nr:RnfABCDGE type electron transport complex subunit B [Candidatus Limnocylindrales bacterium]